MKIALVCVEDGLMSVGFRKIAAFVKTLNPETTGHYVPYQNYRSLKVILLGQHGECADVPEDAIREMAEPLAKADIVGFSSMTGYAGLTADIIRHVRMVNPNAYIIWGGIHPIIVPEDAIKHADAICTGEGEFAFQEFFEQFKAGKDYTKTRNFWFRQNGAVIKNGFLPLMTNEQMSSLPLLQYGDAESIYEPKRGYVPLTTKHYLAYNGLSYNTVWSIGCPFKCTYCGNTKFIENDKTYRKIRHPSVQYIVEEFKQALRVHPHISTIVFHDDSFMALPLRSLQEFSREYKKQVRVPFCIQGVIPNYVRADKLELLLDAGLNRVRMGIQNGSERILKFYDRPTPPPQVFDAASVLAKYSRYMIPPAYDIIVDNPVETREDVVENLRFLYNLPRPFTLNIFSLRTIPNTELERQMRERAISLDEISSNYAHNAPTLANCLIYLIATARIPRFLYNFLLKRARPLLEPQRKYPRLTMLCRGLYLTKRALNHFRFMDFSVVTGRTGYLLQRAGVIGFWDRHFVPRFTLPPPPEPTAPAEPLGIGLQQGMDVPGLQG